jgi:hypothetical protein
MSELPNPAGGTVPPGPTPCEAPAASRPPDATDQLRSLLRFVYTNNPFYLISAGLVFWGLRISFDTKGETFQTGALMAGLIAYTLLLAVASLLLVRLGQVWDDIRTILLVVVLMFLAISVSFDEALAFNSEVGQRYAFGGLAFALLVSAALLWGLRLRLPLGYRIPYYLAIVLFFVYPVAVSRYAHDPQSPVLPWLLFGFSPAAGLLPISLIPAIRRGPDYVRPGGSPWPWPWYPWTLFVLLAAAAGCRANFLCVSFYPVKGEATVFRPYFLVPLLFAVSLLLLEHAVVARRRTVQIAALLAPIGLLVLSITGPADQIDDLGFLDRFMTTLRASPLLVTLIAVGGFYALATLRRVPHAADALTAALALWVVVGPQTVGPRSLAAPQALPLVAIGLVQLGLAVARGSSIRCLAAVGALAAATVIRFGEYPLLGYRGPVVSHVALAAVLVIAAVFGDRFARVLRHAGAVLLLGAGLAAVVGDPPWLAGLPPTLRANYPLMVAAVAVVYGYLVKNRWYYAAAAGTLVCWSVAGGKATYFALRHLVAGLGYIVAGLASLALALLISLWKTGWPRRLLDRWPRAGRQANRES